MSEERSAALGAAPSLGSRRIRSAGRSSGSIEITLPVKLEVLAGVECRFVLRDGPRPEIVLRPDVSAVQAFLHDLWRKLRVGFRSIGEIGEFSPWDFTLALFPSDHPQRRPPLAYADGFVALQASDGADSRRAEALARLLGYMAVAIAERLGLEGSFAVRFGESLAYVMTGAPADLGEDLEHAMARRAFWGDAAAPRAGLPLGDEVWQEATAGLRRIYEQFRAWQEEPEAYARARSRWRRALALEAGTGGSWDADDPQRADVDEPTEPLTRLRRGGPGRWLSREDMA